MSTTPEIVLKPRSPGWSTLIEDLRENGFASTPNGMYISQKFVDEITSAAVEGIADAVRNVTAVKINAHEEVNFPDPEKYDEERESHVRKEIGNWAAYVETGPQFDPAGEYLCGTCHERLEPDQCMWVEGPICMETGGCELYAHGPDQQATKKVTHQFTQIEANYGKCEGGFSCKSCEYSSKVVKADSDGRPLWCSFWGLHVEPKACCARFDVEGMQSPTSDKSLAAYGTSEGVTKAWDTRGRGTKDFKKTSDTVVLSFGRFNPPHRGHALLFDMLDKTAKEKKADAVLFVNPKQNITKDPLTADDKVKFIKMMAPSTLNIQYKPKSEVPDPEDIVKLYSDMGYKHLTVVEGGDREQWFKDLIQPRMDSGEYKFKDWNFVNAGGRTADSSWNASQQREAATRGDYAAFTKGLPEKFPDDAAKEMYDKVRGNLGIKAAAKGWHGVDLDGTIAYYKEFKGITHIGKPIEGEALEQVKKWLAAGEKVKLFTARADEPDAIKPMEEFCQEVFGQKLEITNKKDHNMIDLLDDRARHVEENTGKILASETSSAADQRGTLWNGIKLVGFSGPEEEALRAMLSRIPPELFTYVDIMQSAKELNAKHGRYVSDEKKILFNPGNLTLRQRFGKGEGWIQHAELTVMHEVGHSLYDNLSSEEQQKWLEISGWWKGWKEGQAPAYVETRPGWEHYTSEWTHKAGAKFPRYYSERNPNEDFSDSFAFFMLNKAHQIGDLKRSYFEDYIKAHVKRYPQVSIQSPIRAYGTSEGVTKAWDTRGRGRHEKPPTDRVRDASVRISSLVTERSGYHTARNLTSRLSRTFGRENVTAALRRLQMQGFIRFTRTTSGEGRGRYVIESRRPFGVTETTYPATQAPVPHPETQTSTPVAISSRITNPEPGVRQPKGFLAQNPEDYKNETADDLLDKNIQISSHNIDKFHQDFQMSPVKYRETLLSGIDKIEGLDKSVASNIVNNTTMTFKSGAYRNVWQVSARGPGGLDVSRSIDISEGKVSHLLQEMNEGLQGKGIAKVIFGNSLDLYDHLGLDEVNASAGLSGGGYAWARFGFVPDNSSWQSVASNVVFRADRDPSITPDIKARVKVIAAMSDPRAMWLLAGLKNASGESVGAKLLRGQDWSGSMDLNNHEQYSVARDYVSRVKKG